MPLLLVALMLWSGCKPPEFVSRRFDNFTAYYNTFYNARRAYDTGMQGNRLDEPKVDRLSYIGLFRGAPNAQASREFDSAIRKSADLLRRHPESKWVDDALLLIGKSYFQQRNYVGAEQKFREVIDLESSLVDEARFWLARTLIASDALELAEAEIQASVAREDLDRKWGAMLRLALGELRVKAHDWDGAATELAAGLTRVSDDEVGARAQFLLGQVLETLGRYPEAVKAYRDVEKFTPPYELSYAAKYGAVRVQGLHVDTPAALKSLRSMERDDKHFAYRAELSYLRARLLQEQGRADEAWEIYDELLYDPVYAALVNDLRGRIHYALGELYRDLDKNFVLAAAHFDTASAQLRTQLTAVTQAANRGGVGRPGSTGPARASEQEDLAPEAIRDADELKEAFGAFAKVFENVSLMDSLLVLGRLDPEAYDARILEIRQRRKIELEEERRLQEARQVAAAFARTAAMGDNTSSPPAGNTGNFQSNPNDPTNQAGFLFHRDPTRAQEGKQAFESKWGDRPLVRNWRRVEAVALAIAEGIDPAAEDEFARETTTGDEELPEIDTASIPRDSTTQARMEADRALARYELANTLFLGIGRPDSAAAWYRLVLQDTPQEEVARRALYALAEVQQALGDSLAARRIFERIVEEDGASEFAELGRSRLGLPPMEVAVTDTSALAEAAYERAYQLWQAHQWTAAIDTMVTVAAEFAETEIQPRSLLAVGAIYVEWAGIDSLALDAIVPLTVSDSVLVRSGLADPPVTVHPDSAQVAMTDSTGQSVVPADSLALRPVSGDSTAITVRDSSAVSDEERRAAPRADSLHIVPGDSIRVEMDEPNVALSGDSVRVASVELPPPTRADSLRVAAAESPPVRLDDSLRVAVAESPPVRLDDSLRVAAVDSLQAARGDSVRVAGGDPMMPTASDSLAIVVTDSTGASLVGMATGPADSTAVADVAPTPPEPVDPDAWRHLTVSKILERVASNYKDTPYAVHAGAMKKVVDELLTPEPVVPEADSALADSTLADSLLTDSTLAATVGADSLALPDSVAGRGSERTVRAEDPAAELDEAGIAIPARDIPEQVRPSTTVAETDSTGVAVESQLPETRAPWRVESSPFMRPLDDVEAVYAGWVIVLETVPDLADAPAVRDRYQARLDRWGRAEILTGEWESRPAVFVALGRYETRKDAEDAAEAAGWAVPPEAWLLHIVVLE